MRVWWGGLVVVLGLVFVIAGVTGNAGRLFQVATGKIPGSGDATLAFGETIPGTTAPNTNGGGGGAAPRYSPTGSYPQHPVTTPLVSA